MDTDESRRQREQELSALLDRLQTATRQHDFFATLRRIEALRPEWPRFGRAPRPSQEAIRLGEEPELDFAPAALSRLESRPDGVPRLLVRFFGLLGPQGPMPLHVTELARERQRNHNDPTLARFLDIFHHRLLALFYRTWAQNQPTAQLDRPREDRYAAWLGASFGQSSDLTSPADLPPQARLFQAGLLGVRSRHPEGLAKLLRQYFRVPVRIEEHVAQWLPIDADDRIPLGYAGNRPERARITAAALGVSATQGRKLLDRQYKFRIVLGPLDFERYNDFLPGGVAWPTLREAVHLYAGLDLRWDVQLVLARDQVPEPRADRRVRLGVSTWVGRDPVARDRNDLRLRLSTLLRRAPHPQPLPA